ncbi:type IV pilus modification PilV family protein [Planctomicrobium piriforme]|uniref:Tfp pilus assembly protein PilV n=1 Tax=Planctomicrobium piriforme TaxID=1576369 RepID=A0A1I3RXX6_9PLAN|nr:hypothetical protein [Planctomicrobium piriforme]SFJ50762.1 Tfp pilus assembly protein PilV [Planctomicrobium piriforme]
MIRQPAHYSQLAIRNVAIARSGATLVEVLMSLLIMSVGIVSVFSLFPVAILSSIKATQLTNGKLLEENVVEMLRTNPQILKIPVPSSGTDRGQWAANTSYSANDVVTPTAKPGSCLPSPFLLYYCTTAGTSAASEPSWQISGTTNDGAVTRWSPVAVENYVVDPLGRYFDITAYNRFGFNGVTAWTSGLARSDGGYNTFLNAIPVFTLQDSWTAAFEGIPASIDPTTYSPRTEVTFPTGMALPNVPANSSQARVIFSNLNGTRSQVAYLYSPITAGSTFQVATQVPTTMNGPLRIETFAPRYSYFLTVSRQPFGRAPKVSAVIRFNRAYNYSDEEVYDANFASNGTGGTGFTASSAVAGALSNDQIRIAVGSSEPPPLLQEGNYIFDATNCDWYQIAAIGAPSTVMGSTVYDITATRSIQTQTPETNNASLVGHAILMPGIIKVFDIEL